MRRRVLRVITRLNIGGPARQALMLTRELWPEYETDLVAGTSEPGEGELSDPDVVVERAPLSRSISPLRDLTAFRWLRTRIDAGGYDIVHTHMAKAGTLARGAALRSRRRPKLVHTFHGHVLEGYFNKPIQRTFLEIERRLARRTDALVAVSKEIRDDLLALGIGDEDRWHVIQLGFDLAPMLAVEGPSGALRERIGLAEEVPLVGVLGRLAPIKDHATLLEALARLDGVHLAVLGDGEMRDEIVSRSDSLGISGRVHLIGWWLDVPAAIADLDVVALTSRNEGTPVSLIEAHACGKPVVSTDVGGVRAVVRNWISGSLVPPGDAAAVAAALQGILSDRAAATRMGEQGRAFVRDRFTKDRLVADIRALYTSLLEKQSAR
ncbi:MAG: glycosyltransferase [Actinobacteria bacterium]|nr:glycosyltransferase [Actinomycetota bacterium]